MSYLFIFNK